jgi:hypothetical protein
LLASAAASLVAACGALLDIHDPDGHIADASIVDSDRAGKDVVDSRASDEDEGDANGIAESDVIDSRAIDDDDGNADANTDFADALGEAGPVDSDAASPLNLPPPFDAGCPSSLLSWSPGTLPGLVLWLDAAKGAGSAPGDPVSLWSDQSPAHNDATQTDGGYQPILEVSAIGGLPAVRFDGYTSYLSIADSPSMQWGTSDYAILVVARFSITVGVPDQALFQKSTKSSPYDGPQLYVFSQHPTLDTTALAADSAQVWVVSAQDGLNDAPHVFGARRFGATLEVRVDGQSAGQYSAMPVIDVSAPGMPASIGQNGYDPTTMTEALQGDIAEEVAVKGPISDADLRSLECHLILKYGL